MALAGIGALESYIGRNFEIIQYVHDHMATIQEVADHLTPVEDLVEFRDDVTDLHAKLGLLVEAAELMIQATPAGIGLLLAADAPSQRLLLGLGSAALKDESFFATATDFDALRTHVDAIQGDVDQLIQDMAQRVTYTELATELAVRDTRLDALEASQVINDKINGILQDLATDQEAVQARFTTLEARLDDPTTGLQGMANRLASMGARVDTVEGGIISQAEDIRTLNTQVTGMDGDVQANSQALDSLTNQVSIIDGEIDVQGQAITQLQGEAQDHSNRLDTTAGALNQLTIKVNSNAAAQSSTSTALTLLDNRVVDVENQQSLQSTAIDDLTSRVQQNADGIEIANEKTTSLQSSISGTGNLIGNSAFDPDLSGWTLMSRGSGWLAAQMQRDLDSDRLPPGVHALSLTAAGVPAGVAGMQMDPQPVNGRSQYMLSGYLAAENCTLRLEWRLYNAAGEEIDLGVAAVATDVSPVANLGDWDRQFKMIPIPVDAVMLQLQLWVLDCHTASPKVWLIRPMLEEATALQTHPSPWVDGVNGLPGALASAVQTLTTRLDQTDTRIDSQAEAVTDLHTRIGNLTEWRVVLFSGSGTYDSVGAPLPASLRLLANDAEPAVLFQRGFTLVRFSPDGSFSSATRFDTYASATERTNLTNALNALGPSDAFLLVGQDNTGIKEPTLTAAMERCGAYAYSTVLGSLPYALRGRGGIGKGMGIENFPHTESPWIDFSFTLVNDTPAGIGENGGWVGGLAATADAMQTLGARVTSNEGDLVAQADSLLHLSAQLETAGGVLANEMIITSHKDNVIISTMNTMSGRLTDVSNGLAAQGNTTAGLTTRLDTTDGTVSSHSTQLLQLSNSVTNLQTGASATSDALSSLDNRVTANADGISANGQAISQLTATVNDPATGVAVTADALSKLVIRVTTGEGQTTSNSEAIASLTNQINDSTNGLSAVAAATSSLSTLVTGQGDTLQAQAQSLQTLETAVNGNSATITSQQESIDGVLAKAGITLDVNGFMTGWQLNNDGATGSMKVLSNTFEVVSPSTPDALTWVGDVLVARHGGFMKCIGSGFGAAGNLVEWYGPTMDPSACTVANGISSATTDGSVTFNNGTFTGDVSARTLSGAFTSSVSVAWSGSIGSYSNTGTDAFVCPPPVRVGDVHRPEIVVEVLMNRGGGSLAASGTVYLDRYDNGSWTEVTKRTYALPAYGSSGQAFVHLDIPTSEATSYRWRFGNGDQTTIYMTQINGRILGQRTA